MTLDLSENRLAKLEHLASTAPALESLNVNKNALKDAASIAELAALTQLKNLQIERNELAGEEIVRAFAAIPALCGVNAAGNPCVSKIPQWRKKCLCAMPLLASRTPASKSPRGAVSTPRRRRGAAARASTTRSRIEAATSPRRRRAGVVLVCVRRPRSLGTRRRYLDRPVFEGERAAALASRPARGNQSAFQIGLPETAFHRPSFRLPDARRGAGAVLNILPNFWRHSSFTRPGGGPGPAV